MFLISFPLGLHALPFTIHLKILLHGYNTPSSSTVELTFLPSGLYLASTGLERSVHRMIENANLRYDAKYIPYTNLFNMICEYEDTSHCVYEKNGGISI